MKKRTMVYIDGFNLYYGCLKDSPYKWLDLKKLCENLLSEDHTLCQIKYFTSFISDRTDNTEAMVRQRNYLGAIKSHIPTLDIYYGHYLTHKIMAKNVNPPPDFVTVYRTEEKGTDVNIGLQILNDAWLNKYYCVILISNDSDLASALELVRNDHKKMVGVIFPSVNKKRKPSRELIKHSHFVKRIRHEVLLNSQLPAKVKNATFDPYVKPKEWN